MESSNLIRRRPSNTSLYVAASSPRARVLAASPRIALQLLLLHLGVSHAHTDRVLAAAARRTLRGMPPEEARTSAPPSGPRAVRRASPRGSPTSRPRAGRRAPQRTTAVPKASEPRRAAIGGRAQRHRTRAARAEGGAAGLARSGGSGRSLSVG